jgi:nicotinamidase-related amidase
VLNDRTRGTALLLMDLMPITVPAFGGDDALLHRLADAAAAARAAGVTVVHVRVCFRSGYPELSPANKVFATVAAAMDFTEANAATQVHPALAPREGDVVVTKRRVSAFTGSDLDVVLRSRSIHTLVLAGVATSGVVLSTLRQAADLDLRLTVLCDGCADADPEVHRVLTEKVFPAQAEVVTVAGWITSLPG